MSKRKPIETEEELVQTVYQLFADVDPELPEEIDELLEAEGYNADAFAEEIEAFAARALAETPLNWRNRARQEIENQRQKLQKLTTSDRIVNREEIQRLLEQLRIKNPSVYAFYRNFEDESNADLSALRAELQYLLEEDGAEEE